VSPALTRAALPEPAAPAALGPTDPAEVEAFLDGLLAAELQDRHIPGAVVVVVRGGEVLFAKGYGYADLEARVPVDPARTLFRPGSISKLFTWTAVMQLVEQGRLSLDADVNTYLDFEIPATFPEPITLKHLLTHTPGFEDQGQGLFVLRPESLVSLEAYLKANLPARVFPPGQIGAYSNYGTALAGYIVERVSGQSFDAYVEEHIFAPLGMTQATFRQPLPPALAPQMSNGYNYVNGGYLRGGFEYVGAYPAGSLSAAGLDLARFMIAHLQDGRYGEARILSEATARQMHAQLLTPDPRLTGMAHGFFLSEVNGQRVISHGGDTLLFHSGLFLLPEQNTGFYLSTNGATGSLAVSSVATAFMDRYYPPPAPPAPIPTADFASRAASYAGSYYLARSGFTTLEKFITLTTPINVTVDAENNVIVSVMGETTQYVEVEPGLLQGRLDPEQRLVLRQADGQVYLIPPTPFVFIKAPWHRSAGLHLLLLAGGALLFLVTLVAWAVSFVRGLLRREPRPLGARLSRLAAALFGLVFLAFVVFLGLAFGDVDPAYGVPRVFFETPAWFGIVGALPWIAAALALPLVPLAFLAWRRRYWNVAGRAFYTFLAVAALGMVWSLNYWNFL
jgi:CubicO group peptidase (beta-lactamase class C family)